MIHSMTAFARRDMKSEWGNGAWEIRSVNQRYLEIYIRLPECFRNIEIIIRDRLRSRLTRGKVECSLYFEFISNQQNELALNEKLVNQLIKGANFVKKSTGEGEINPIEILRWPGVILSQENNLDCVSKYLLNEIEFALADFVFNREREGKKIKIMIEKRLNAICKELKKIRRKMPEIFKWQSERLRKKIEEINIQIDNNRLEQEFLILAQRIDVAEELDRLDAHIKETRNILKKKKLLGVD